MHVKYLDPLNLNRVWNSIYNGAGRTLSRRHRQSEYFYGSLMPHSTLRAGYKASSVTAYTILPPLLDYFWIRSFLHRFKLLGTCCAASTCFIFIFINTVYTKKKRKNDFILNFLGSKYCDVHRKTIIRLTTVRRIA